MDVRKEQQMSRWTLRFVSDDVESAFLRGRCESMCLNLSRCAAIVSGIYALQLARHYLSSTRDMGPGMTRERFPAQVDLLATQIIVLVAVFGAVSVLMRLPWVIRRLSFRMCEALVFLLLTFLLGMALFWGILFLTPRECEDYGLSRLYRTTLLALLLDAVLTVSHLVLPTRWIVMVVSDAVYLVTFVAFHWTFDAGGAKMDATGVMMFTALTIGASLGLWSKELNERTMFITIAGERTLRAVAEHHAAFGPGPGGRP